MGAELGLLPPPQPADSYRKSAQIAPPCTSQSSQPSLTYFTPRRVRAACDHSKGIGKIEQQNDSACRARTSDLTVNSRAL